MCSSWTQKYVLAGRPIGTSQDLLDASQSLEDAKYDLFSRQIAVTVSELGPAKPYFVRPLFTQNELAQYLARTSSAATRDLTRIFVIPQEHSRAPLDITLSGLDSIFAFLNPFPAISKITSAFITSGTDSYLGRNSVHFGPHTEPKTSKILELCCLLKYVEENYRRGDLTRWSIRQMGLYQQYNADSHIDTTLLIHPSDSLWSRIKTEFKNNPDGQRSWKHWTMMPVLIFKSLGAGWSDYVTFLHDKSVAINTNASFTDPKHPKVGEANNESLKDCSAHIEVLNIASHALQSNISVLEAFAAEERKRQSWVSVKSDEDHDVFQGVIEDVVRELRSSREHVHLIRAGLQQTVAMVRDLMSIRNTYTVEQLTIRSIFEARAVRIITLVALFFLPASFTATFLDMDYLHVTSVSNHGLLEISADPNMWIYLALTLPLMAVTLGGWLLWEWYSSRKNKITELAIV